MIVKNETFQKSVFCFCLMLFLSYIYSVQIEPRPRKLPDIGAVYVAPQSADQNITANVSSKGSIFDTVSDNDGSDVASRVSQPSEGFELAFNTVLTKTFSPLRVTP